jgi:hypothetical protein
MTDCNVNKQTVVVSSYYKNQRDALFLALFGKELYVFRTDLLSIIRSLNTVYTAIGICHTSYVDSARKVGMDLASGQST